MKDNYFIKRITPSSVVLLSPVRCGGTQANRYLPPDTLGSCVGISKDDTERSSMGIGQLIREDKIRKQVRVLKENAMFEELNVGHDQENQVQFLTKFAKSKNCRPMCFEEVSKSPQTRNFVCIKLFGLHELIRDIRK